MADKLGRTHSKENPDTGHRIDGGVAGMSLRERINSEDRVGSSLASTTIMDYLNKIHSMEKRLIKAGQGAMTGSKLAELLQEKIDAAEISHATGRSLRSSALFWLAVEGQARVDEDLPLGDLEDAYRAVRNMSLDALPKKTIKTSSPRNKHLSDDLMEQVITQIHNNPRYGRESHKLLAFLRANLLVGLRPSEWFGAKLSTHYFVDKDKNPILNSEGRATAVASLVVSNAKTTHGRGNGLSREILLHDVTAEELAILQHYINIANEAIDSIAVGADRSLQSFKFYSLMRKSLVRALKSIGYAGPGLPTLYSTRHQVVANAKNSGLSLREVAAFFGHSSLMTSKRHYGRKSSGSGILRFRPSEASIQAVPMKTNTQEISAPSQRVINEARKRHAELQPLKPDNQ